MTLKTKNIISGCIFPIHFSVSVSDVPCELLCYYSHTMEEDFVPLFVR